MPRLSTFFAFAILTVLTVTLAGRPTADVTASGPPLAELESPFAASYTLTDLGVAPGFEGALGAVIFDQDDPDTLIYGLFVGGEGRLHTVSVERDADGHITGFVGTREFLANAPAIDGGADFAPNGVLMVTTYGGTPDGNRLLQYKPGSTEPDKVTDLASIGIDGSVGALRFVPPGFPGEGKLKITSYGEDAWYTILYTENAQGTYDVCLASLDAEFPHDAGPESPVYVRPGPLFPGPSVLIAEYNVSEIAAYEVDANGDPIMGTRRVFMSDPLNNFGPAGMVSDPVTGDLIVADYGFGHVLVVEGFALAAVKGDLNCDGVVDGRDVVISIRYAAGVALHLPVGCPEVGGPYPEVSAAGVDNFVGDVNCDNSVDELDALALARYIGGLPNDFDDVVGCKVIGSS